MPNRTFADLQAMQRLPLEAKVCTTQARIYDWIDKWGADGVYVAFSGGKDSTVLLHLVREIALDVAAVFVDTGLEYPEVKRFAKSFDNVTVLRPKMRFDEVIKKYGYPLISKEVSECVSQARRFVQGTTRGGIRIAQINSVSARPILQNCRCRQIGEPQGCWGC